MINQSFITRYTNGLSNQLINSVYVKPHGAIYNSMVDLGQELRAQWDTGATGTVLSSKLAYDLDLKPISIARTEGVGGTFDSNVYYVDIYLPNKVVVTKLRVTEADFSDIDVLIGMDIIMQGDFAVSNYAGNTSFTFRMPSRSELNFVDYEY